MIAYVSLALLLILFAFLAALQLGRVDALGEE